MTNSGSPEPTASYKVTPDADLFAQIKALPGVLDSNIHFIDKFGWGRKYEGTIFVAPDTTTDDAITLLDHANAILWMGRPNADLTVTVAAMDGNVQRDLATQTDLGIVDELVDPDTGKFTYARDAARARYGPQPGTGKPRSVSPALSPEPPPATQSATP